MAELLGILGALLFLYASAKFILRVSPRAAGRVLFLGKALFGGNSPLRLVVIFYQVLNGFDSVVAIKWPPLFLQLMGVVELFAFDFGTLPQGCTFDTGYTFYHQMVLTACMPFAVVLIPLLLFKLISLVQRCTGCLMKHQGLDSAVSSTFSADQMEKHAEKSERRAKFMMSVALWITFLAFPSVCAKIFRGFVCQGFDEGHSYLRADLSVDCQGPDRPLWLVVTVLLLLVWPLGVPAFYSWRLWQVHKVYKLTHVGSGSSSMMKLLKGSKRLNQVSFLYKPYVIECWWFEIFECGRKVVLCGLVLFIAPGTPEQLVCSGLICMMAVVVLCLYKPLKNPMLMKTSILLQIMLMLIIMLSVLTKCKEESSNLLALDVLLVVLTICPLLILPYAVYVQAKVLRAEVKAAAAAKVAKEEKRKSIAGAQPKKEGKDKDRPQEQVEKLAEQLEKHVAALEKPANVNVADSHV